MDRGAPLPCKVARQLMRSDLVVGLANRQVDNFRHSFSVLVALLPNSWIVQSILFVSASRKIFFRLLVHQDKNIFTPC